MIRSWNHRPPGDPQEAAIWWATRHQLHPERAADDKAFEDWLREPRNAEAWAGIERRLNIMSAFAGMPEIRDMRREALASLRRQQRSPRFVRLRHVAVAASLAIAIALVWSASVVRTPLMPVDEPVVPAPQRYTTSTGERRDVRLEDGSVITLNTASTVEVRYSQDRRDVRLISGQALFQVAGDPHRPFVVTAANRLITALGTSFDVQVKDDGRMSVLLIEGRVSVEPLHASGLARLVPVLARSELNPGQRLAASASGRDDVSIADVEREVAWQRGLLIFRSDLLADAVAEVNRYSSAQIVIGDPQMNSLKVSGVFPTERSEDFIAALQKFYPIVAERISPTAVVLKWQPTSVGDDFHSGVRKSRNPAS